MVYHTRNRTRNGTPTQGSAFHKLIVLPTLAPHLAHPYHVPGTDIVYNTEFANQIQGMSAHPTTLHNDLCPNLQSTSMYALMSRSIILVTQKLGRKKDTL